MLGTRTRNFITLASLLIFSLESPLQFAFALMRLHLIARQGLDDWIPPNHPNTSPVHESWLEDVYISSESSLEKKRILSHFSSLTCQHSKLISNISFFPQKTSAIAVWIYHWLGTSSCLLNNNAAKPQRNLCNLLISTKKFIGIFFVSKRILRERRNRHSWGKKRCKRIS